MWAYGLHLALAGHEDPVTVGPSSEIAKGYRDGADMLPSGVPLVLDHPLGAERPGWAERRV